MAEFTLRARRHQMIGVLLIGVLAMTVLAACASRGDPTATGQPAAPQSGRAGAQTDASATTPATTPAVSGPAASNAAALPHVFVIVMENKSPGDVLKAPYIKGLAGRYALATNYHAVAHPSLPNYLALTSGSTWGIKDDGYHRLPEGGLGLELTAQGVSWRGYFEGFTGDCFRSPYPYALKHNPFAYYGGQCPENIVPLTHLASDLAGSVPSLSWITPGLCNDMHDCSVDTGDRWLSTTVPQIVTSPAWRNHGVLFITWDEDDGSSSQNRVPTIVVAPNLNTHEMAGSLNHYALLATIQDLLGVPRLGQAAGAPSMAGILG